MFHRFTAELTLALVAGVLVLAGIGLSIFGPATFSYGTNWLTAGAASVWSSGIDSNVVIYLGAMLAGAVLVLMGAYLRRDEAGAGPLAFMWTGVLILGGGALLALPGSTNAVLPVTLHTSSPDSVGIGIYMIPAALAALFAALVASAVHHPRRPIVLHPH